jgi:small subunit ribosomal protein S20
MPIIKSAKKKLRQDYKRTAANVQTKQEYREAIKDAKKNPTKKDATQKAYSAIDTAVKKNVIHKNKAARLKSQLTRPNGKS